MEKTPSPLLPGFRRRAFLEINYIKMFFVAAIIGITLFCFYSFLPLLNSVLIAMVISYLASPMVVFFERKQIPRIWAVLLVFSLILVIGVGLFFIVKRMIPSKSDLLLMQGKIMQGFEQCKVIIGTFLTNRFGIDGNEIVSKIDISSLFSDLFGRFQLSGVTAGVGKVISGVSNVASLTLISCVLLFFFLLRGRDFERTLFSLIPNKYFEMTVITWREIDRMFGNYIRGTLIESFVIGILTLIGWHICGVAFVAALIGGVIVGLLNAIPYIGPFLGGVVGVCMYSFRLIPIGNESIFGISPNLFNIILIIVIVQALDQVIKPLILSQSVKLPGIIVFLGIIAGGKLFGFVGMVFAIPVIAVFKIVAGTLYKQLVGFGFLTPKLVSVVSVLEKEE